MSAIKKWIDKEIMFMVRKGGKKVTADVFAKRQSICDSCDMKTMVKLPMGTEVPGCGDCKCPFETKLWFETHIISFLKGQEKVRCGHPEGDKW